MNKQSLNKLKLFLTGLESRIEENKEYFKKIDLIFKSGTKKFPGSVVLLEEKLKISYSGNSETIEINSLALSLTKLAENYDSLQITYEERGTTIFIEADDKNVKMKTKENQVEEVLSKLPMKSGEPPYL